MGVAAFVIAAVLCVAVVVVWSRSGPIRMDRGDDRAVDYVSLFIATAYLVLLALVVVVQWQYVDAVNTDVRAEVGSLRQLGEAADRLPAPTGAAVHGAAVAYATAVVSHEWPASSESGAPQADAALEQAKTVLMTPKKLGDQVGNIEDQGLTAIDTIIDARADRLAVSRHGVPGAVLALLVVFSVLTIVIPLALGLRHDAYTIVGMTALMLTVIAGLWFAFDLSDEYTGLIKVSDEPLRAFVSGHTS